MTVRNPSKWLANMLGPIDFQVDGVAASVERRATVNLIGMTVEDDPDNERTNVTGGGGGGSFTAPTGTGLMTTTAGAMDAASTGLGTAHQVLRTNAGATDTEWASPVELPLPLADLDPAGAANGDVVTRVAGVWSYATPSGGGTLVGDASGAIGSNTVDKIKGTTITTAGGALAVGAVLRTTAVGTADWGALDLADADARTGVLPTANQAAQSLSGDATGTTAAVTNTLARGLKSATTTVSVSAATAPTAGMALTATASTTATWQKVDTTSAAAIIVPSTADGIITSAGAGASNYLQQAANVLAGSGYISIGASPATAGAIRLANATYIQANYAAANRIVAGVDNSDNCVLGGYWDGTSNCTQTFINATSFILGRIAGNTVVQWSATTIEVANPIIGFASPHGVHGVAAPVAMGGTSYTVTSAEYIYDYMQFGDSADNLSIYLPTPASEAASYTKEIYFTGSGTTLKLYRADGAGAYVTLSNGYKVRVRVRPGGVYACYPEVYGA